MEVVVQTPSSLLWPCRSLGTSPRIQFHINYCFHLINSPCNKIMSFSSAIQDVIYRKTMTYLQWSMLTHHQTQLNLHFIHLNQMQTSIELMIQLFHHFISHSTLLGVIQSVISLHSVLLYPCRLLYHQLRRWWNQDCQLLRWKMAV